jgi:UDP-3-O-[3-hydroxymyristoyl] glucosamine N-acyltransferase
VVLGDRVVLGGGVGVADHVKVGDDAVIMGMSGVASNIQPQSIVGGIPAIPRDRIIENHFNFNRIKSFMKKIDALVSRIDVLEQKTNND